MTKLRERIDEAQMRCTQLYNDGRLSNADKTDANALLSRAECAGSDRDSETYLAAANLILDENQ